MEVFIAIDAQVEDRILETADLAGSGHELAYSQCFDLRSISQVNEHIAGFCPELLEAIVARQSQKTELFFSQYQMIEMWLWRLLGFAVIDNSDQYINGIPFTGIHKFHKVCQLIIVSNNEHTLHLLPVQELFTAFGHFLFGNELQCYVLNNGHVI